MAFFYPWWNTPVGVGQSPFVSPTGCMPVAGTVFDRRFMRLQKLFLFFPSNVHFFLQRFFFFLNNFKLTHKFQE